MQAILETVWFTNVGKEQLFELTKEAAKFKVSGGGGDGHKF